jgi:preprotein translocase subunit YajC
MNYLAFLLETATEGGDATQTLGGGMGFTWIVMIIMLVVMWVISSNSQKKKDKEAQDMRDSLQVGDEVTTIGGIIGKVVSIKEETFVLETTKEKTHIRFLKGAIRSVDVRIADLTGATETPVQETPAEEKPKMFGFFKRNK